MIKPGQIMDQEKKTFHIQTFGCQMNERDSETLAGMLTEMGYAEEANKKKADIVIINTCSVRENADKRFFGTLGQLKKIKEERPEFIACVCGCMMQQQHVIDTIKAKYPWVDIIFGTHNIHEFPGLLRRVSQEHVKARQVWEAEGEIVEGLPSKRVYAHKAFVNIMFGCDNFCTYCIVPYTRGRERSRDPWEIKREVEALVADGVREITLLGQNVNSYQGGGMDFPDLTALLDQVPGLSRLRFMTSHPKDISDKLIKAFGSSRTLCPSIHLPVQSGSDRVLKDMNRNYTAEDYLSLVKRLRRVSPDICITTDIIVGFPGETEEDFQETLDLCRQVEFDAAFTFLYSVRLGTPAAEYGNQVEEGVKHARFNRLVDEINRVSAEKNAAYEGKTVEVLVDGPSKTNPDTMTGRTPGYKLVDFVGPVANPGEIVNVEITQGRTFSLRGRRCL